MARPDFSHAQLLGHQVLLVRLIRLVSLVCLVYLVYLVSLVPLYAGQNRRDRQDRPDRLNTQDSDLSTSKCHQLWNFRVLSWSEEIQLVFASSYLA